MASRKFIVEATHLMSLRCEKFMWEFAISQSTILTMHFHFSFQHPQALFSHFADNKQVIIFNCNTFRTRNCLCKRRGNAFNYSRSIKAPNCDLIPLNGSLFVFKTGPRNRHFTSKTATESFNDTPRMLSRRASTPSLK